VHITAEEGTPVQTAVSWSGRLHEGIRADAHPGLAKARGVVWSVFMARSRRAAGVVRSAHWRCVRISFRDKFSKWQAPVIGMPIVSCTTRIGGATKSRVLADTQPKIVMNALAKQPFADFTAEQKRYKFTLRVTLANGFRNWRFSWLRSRWSRGFSGS
jgi:hypothetical protein